MTTLIAPTSARTRPTRDTTSSTFRPDIQGLRAIAVLAVAFDHAGFGLFSGGYVGVDVFFVISGFLITQLLLREAAGTGTISLRSFYSRRARRILPAATVVIAATLLFSVKLLGYVQAWSVVKDSIWAAMFASNVEFGRQQTDYFSREAPPSPLLHFWSLSIEEQFYLVWPLLLLLVLAGVAAWRRRLTARSGTRQPGPAERPRLPVGAIAAAMLVVGGASYLWSERLTAVDRTGAYFATTARVWELTVGAMCALVVAAACHLPVPIRVAMAWTGLACVGWAIFAYSASTPFPGRAALLPVLGTAMLVLGGAGRVSTGPKVLLGRGALRLVGDWSYSFYLWHWPVLLLTASYLARPLTLQESVSLLVLALGLAAVTYEYVENPFRRSRTLAAPPARGVALYPASIAVVLLASLWAYGAIGDEVAAASRAPGITTPGAQSGSPTDVPQVDPAVALVRASAQAAREHQPVPGVLDPPLLDLTADLPEIGDCDYSEPVRKLCVAGDPTAHRSIVLFGDSHARAWIPAIEPIAKRAGFAAYYLVKPGCAAADTEAVGFHALWPECVSWREWAMEQIAHLHPTVLIVASTLPTENPGVPASGPVTTDGGLADAYRPALATSLHRLSRSVGQVAMIGDVPGLDESPAFCLSRRNADLGSCASAPSARWRTWFDTERSVATKGGYPFVDPTRWFCADRLCPAVVGSTVTYRDDEHVSAQYAAALSRPLEQALDLPASRLPAGG